MNGKSLKLNAILNVIRQLSSILFPLITFPYISRVLQANSYGKISFGQSIISYFSLFAALGITNYAIREGSRIRGNKKEIERFSCEIFTINIITTTISYLLFFIILLLNRRLYEYKSLLIILSFSMFFAALGVEWIYTIYEDYLYITIRSLIVQIISVILMFVFIHSPEDYLFYAGITVFAAGGDRKSVV